jgi:N6-adenosine-specific RNA methylase IME4
MSAVAHGVPATHGLNLPGTLSRTGWVLPENLTFEDWVSCGKTLRKIEGSIQWWLGDWWAYGNHAYGERVRALEAGLVGDLKFPTVHSYGTVARAIGGDRRRSLVSFSHHREVAALPVEQQDRWLDRAESEDLSVHKMRAAIRQRAAADRTRSIEFNAASLGKFAVILADPPWRYEHPPMGGTSRSIENHYPTETLEDICALPVADIAHDNSLLFLWATAPKLYECMKVVDAWGFVYRTQMVWVKDKIGMGYYVRNQHETLLICRRGELPPPPEKVRRSSVVHAPRLEHSAKPPIFYDIIDAMYPGLRKIELFSRSRREGWEAWGNEAGVPSATIVQSAAAE